MQHALRRAPLERALQVAIVVTVFGAMLASGAILDWLAAGRKLRWAGLLALVALAVAYARSRGVRARPLVPYALAAAFAVLAVLSVTWSADPRSSVGRGGAFALLLAAAALIASAGGGRLALDGALAAIALVALAGVVVLIADPSRAIAEATPREPARYQGLGGNPNSATLLLAFGIPLAAAWFAAARTRLPRFLAAALLVLLVGSITASGSRGAILGAFFGLAVTLAIGVAGRRRKVVAVAAAIGAAVLALAVSELPRPDPNAEVPRARATGPAQTGGGYFNAEAYLPLEDELGHPPFGVAAPEERSTLLGSSGRAQGWDWSVRHALERPLLGYGFGAEDEAFIDRLAAFQADTPENGYLGVLLQLGVVGLVLFGVLAAAIALRARDAGRVGWAAAGAAGAFACGLALTLVQSYPYAPGGVATLVLWLCAFALVGLTADARA